MSKINNYYMSEPTREFEIGQRVVLGGLEHPIITWKSEDKKVYKVSYLPRKPYSRPDEYLDRVENENEFPWFDIFSFENKNTNFAKKSFNFNVFSQTVQSLLNRYYHSGINMDPEYQRGYVWSQEDKELYIDSIFEGRDLGKFVFAVTGYKKPIFEIVDGKQRLNTIIEFYEGRLKYKGILFHELSFTDRNKFTEGNMISVLELGNLDKPATLKYKLECFFFFNSGGVVMDKKFLNNLKEKYSETLKGDANEQN